MIVSDEVFLPIVSPRSLHKVYNLIAVVYNPAS